MKSTERKSSSESIKGCRHHRLFFATSKVAQFPETALLIRISLILFSFLSVNCDHHLPLLIAFFPHAFVLLGHALFLIMRSQ